MTHKHLEHERRFQYWNPIHEQNIKALEVSTERLATIQHVGQLVMPLMFNAEVKS